MQRIIRAQFGDDMSIHVRKVEHGNMMDIIQEAKEKRWRDIVVDLDSQDTANFMLIVRGC